MPSSHKHNVGDIQSGSIHLSKEGKGISSFGLNHTNNKYIPRRSGGMTGGEGTRLRDKEVRSNYE